MSSRPSQSAPNIPLLRSGLLSLSLTAALGAHSGSALAGADGLKNIAILGSLLAYGHGYSLSDRLACERSFRGGLHYLKDGELTTQAFSLGLQDCDAQVTTGPAQGLTFRLSPTVMLSGWTADTSATYSGTSEVTFTPKIFYSWPAMGSRLDVGFGIGISYLMDPSVGNRRKSTNFQFSDEFSFGISDATDTYRLAYQYRHISNADIGTPNNGVDFSGLTFTVRMR